MTSFIRKVPTASGARAVQIVHKRGREVVGIEHIGSAHDDAELALLYEVARQRLHPHQDEFDFPTTTPTGGAQVVAMTSQVLWDVLAEAYRRLGFDAVGDDAFRAMVLARIIEPTSKADTLRVLDEIGVACPSLRTLFRALGRCQERGYRDLLARACMGFSAGRNPGPGGLVLYDVTVRHEALVVRVGVRDLHRGFLP